MCGSGWGLAPSSATVSVLVQVGRTPRVESGDGEVEEWRVEECETNWKSYEGTLLTKPRAVLMYSVLYS